MGCGASKSREEELRIDEIEEKKVAEEPVRRGSGKSANAVESLGPRSRYAASTDAEDPVDELVNGGAALVNGRAFQGKKKKKRRDDDDDDDDEEAAAPAKDRDIERLLASYKDRPVPAAHSSTLYANKHAQAMRRAEQQREEATPTAVATIGPSKRVNLATVLADEEDLGDNGDDDEADEEPRSPAMRGNWSANVDGVYGADIAAMTQPAGFQLAPRANKPGTMFPRIATATAPHSPPQAAMMPHARESLPSITAHKVGVAVELDRTADLMPGLIEEEDHSHSSSSDAGRPRGGAKRNTGGLPSTTKSNPMSLASSQQPTRNNTQRGHHAARTNMQDADEFAY